MADPQQHDAAAIIEAVERLAQHQVITEPLLDLRDPRDLALAVLPEGKRLEDLRPYLDDLLDAPRRIEAAAQASQIQSLIAYLNRFKLADSVIFADDSPAAASLVGIVDFHGAAGGRDQTPGGVATPRFGHHTVSYKFPLSDQFRAWSAISGKGLSHVEMADFLNDRAYDIANPPIDWMQVDQATVGLILKLLNLGDDMGEVDDADPDPEAQEDGEDRWIPRSALYKLRRIRFGSANRLLQMARTVEISADAKTIEGYNSKTGERTIQFEETHEARSAGRRVIVPDGLLLRIPVFEGETPQLLPVRLQYRRGGQGGVKWFMTLVEYKRAIRFAVQAEAERAARETGLPLFYGSRG